MSTRNLPPTRSCTNPKHTGELRMQLGCVGPDPSAPAPAPAAALAVEEPTPAEAALAEQLRAEVRRLEARRLAALRALHFRQAAAEAHEEGNRLYGDMGQKAAQGAWSVRDMLRRRADAIQAAADTDTATATEGPTL